MKTIGDVIKYLRKQRRMSQADLAFAAETDAGNISRIERNQQGFSQKRLELIARTLDLTVSELHSMVEGELRPIERKGRLVPILDKVQAGKPKEITMSGIEYKMEWIDTEMDGELGPHAFQMIIEGDSNKDEFWPGDRILVDPDILPKPGNMVVAYIEKDNAACFKKYRPRGDDDNGYPIIELVPLNEDYPNITLSVKNPGHIVGTMMYHIKKRRP